MSNETERRKLMKEEDKLQKMIGTENPFRVPEGYFESLTSEVMNRLPEKEKSLGAIRKESTMWERVRPWLYMTAMFIGAALIIRVASTDRTPAADRVAAEESETEMEYINMAVDNSMLDDYSLYVYLADSSAE